MIFGSFGQKKFQKELTPSLREALEFAEKNFSRLEPGRHEIRGAELFALVSDYRTKPLNQVRFESHRKYIDIQMLASGSETILWAPISSLRIAEVYDEEKDVGFYEHPSTDIPIPIPLVPDHFAIFMPDDGHAPGGQSAEIEKVRKIVIKVKA